ncbi:MAG TPA: DUF3488 and transglutaminase-like domain-containing protein, partial [Gammaproteobacteria bacterium]
MSVLRFMRRNETRRLVWTAGVILGASLPHWPTLPIWAPILLCACIGWRLLTDLKNWPLPNRLVRIVLAITALVAILERYHTVNGVEAGSALLVVMVALKFLETRSNRDQLVLLIIAYFILFAGLLAQRNPLILAYLAVFVWFTTIGLMQLGRQGPLLPMRDTARLSGRLLLQAAPVMIVLFLLFPRLPGPLWAMPGANSFGRTGLSDEMSPGDITELGLSDEVAFRVEFFSPPPGPGELYWRGPVLSNFNGRTWSQGATEFRRGIEDTLEFLGDPVDYRVMIEPTGRRWVFALDMAAEWPEGENIIMESHYQLQRFPNRIRSRQDYTLRSYPDYRAGEQLSQAQRNAYLYLPEDYNPRSHALAVEWRATAAGPREIIERALQIFREQTFFYTLTPPPLGVHTADDFLFEAREGFCEHYASAFTILMRAAGIPARVVTGYQGGELNPLGQYYIIYQSNAHAWTEVWLEDEGWIRVDPTAAVAPDRISSGLYGSALSGQRAAGGAFRNIPWLRDLALAWDAANTYWNDWVLGYGPEIQRALMESLGIARPHWAKLIAIGVALLVVFLGGLMLYLAWIYRSARRTDPASRHFRKFCRKLAHANIPPRRPCEGPADFGRRAAASMPSASADIGEITDAYLRARYEMD